MRIAAAFGVDRSVVMESFRAIFEDGVFRPTVPVSFPDHCEVELEARIIKGELIQDLDAIYAVMNLRYNSGEGDIAARHNEHQP